MTDTLLAWPFPASVAANHFIRTFSLEQKDEAARLRDRLVAGQFYVIAPPSAEPEQLRNLDAGGLFPPREKFRHGASLVQALENCNLALAEVITATLGPTSQARLWIHEPLLAEDELSASRLPFRRLGANTFLTFDKGLRDAREVCGFLEYSPLSWHFLAIATRDGADIGAVDTLIRRADVIAAGAYDCEGFLVWLAAGPAG